MLKDDIGISDDSNAAQTIRGQSCVMADSSEQRRLHKGQEPTGIKALKLKEA